MKLENINVNATILRALDIAAPVLDKRDPDCEIELIDNAILFKLKNEYNHFTTVLEICERLDKYMPCNFSCYDKPDSCKIVLHSFWENAIPCNALAIRKVVLHATRNMIPEDKAINNLSGKINFDSDDGVGIVGKCGNHTIRFEVEGINYKWDRKAERECPTIWYAHGNMDGFKVELLAGSEAHAFSKIIRAFHRKAIETDPEFANDIYDNRIKWESYGFCN